MPLKYGLLTDVSPPVGVRIGVANLDHLCPRIHPEVDRCLGLLPLHQQSYIPLVQVWCQKVTSGRESRARRLLQCMSKQLSRLNISIGRLRPGLFFQEGLVFWPYASHCRDHVYNTEQSETIKAWLK